MKKLITFTLVVIWGLTPLFSQYKKLNEYKSIVFLGNSITHRCQYSGFIENFLITRFPQQQFKFHTAGVGGDHSSDALIRFNAEVKRYNPDLVTILFGMNDASYVPFSREVFDRYTKNMTTLINSVKQINATPVIITPTIFDYNYAIRLDWFKNKQYMCKTYNGTLSFYGAWLQEYAIVNKLPFVDLWTPLNDYNRKQRRINPEFTIVPDGVHPDLLGMAIMAINFVEQMQKPSELFNIDIEVNKKQIINYNAENCKIKNLTKNKKNITFDCIPNSLPWIFPNDISIPLEKYNKLTSINKQMVYISGLPKGKYCVTLDNDTLGIKNNHELAKGIDLQNIKSNAWKRQASEICKINTKRNKILYPLRDMWVNKKTISKLEKKLLESPKNVDIKNRIKHLKSKVVNFDEREKQILKKANGMINDLYKINKPKTIKIQIKLISK